MNSLAARAFAQHVVDLLAMWAPVQARAMFGGFGLYREGRMFALIASETLYFKADATSANEYIRHGLPPFTYQSAGKTSTLKYFAAPAEVYEDAQHMAHWANLAWQSAQRQAAQPAKAAKTVKRSHDLADLRNIGGKSIEMMTKAGILSLEDLKACGSVQAYLRVLQVWPRASLNLLWALEGALTDRDWQVVARDDRASLLMALEDAKRMF